jgi:hypothetical protein
MVSVFWIAAWFLASSSSLVFYRETATAAIYSDDMPSMPAGIAGRETVPLDGVAMAGAGKLMVAGLVS